MKIARLDREMARQVEHIQALELVESLLRNQTFGDLATFCAFFARFEFALKASGYVKAAKDGHAEPDWAAFAKNAEAWYNTAKRQDERLMTSAAFLLGAPPMKQLIENGALVFSHDRSVDADSIDRVLTLVRRARNNLFHGAKFSESAADRHRDKQLIVHCLRILDASLDADAGVKKFFLKITLNAYD